MRINKTIIEIEKIKTQLAENTINLSQAILSLKNIDEIRKYNNFYNFLTKENDGYLPEDEIPLYRIFIGQVLGRTPYQTRIQVNFSNPDEERSFSRKNMTEGIEVLENIRAGKQNSSDDLTVYIGRNGVTDLHLYVSDTCLPNLFSKVRTRILDNLNLIEKNLKRRLLISNLILLLSVFIFTYYFQSNIILFTLFSVFSFLIIISLVVSAIKPNAILESIVSNGIYDLIKLAIIFITGSIGIKEFITKILN